MLGPVSTGDPSLTITSESPRVHSRENVNSIPVARWMRSGHWVSVTEGVPKILRELVDKHTIDQSAATCRVADIRRVYVVETIRGYWLDLEPDPQRVAIGLALATLLVAFVVSLAR